MFVRSRARGLVAEVDGSIAAILDFAAAAERGRNGVMVAMVPGAGVL